MPSVSNLLSRRRNVWHQASSRYAYSRTVNCCCCYCSRLRLRSSSHRRPAAARTNHSAITKDCKWHNDRNQIRLLRPKCILTNGGPLNYYYYYYTDRDTYTISFRYCEWLDGIYAMKYIASGIYRTIILFVDWYLTYWLCSRIGTMLVILTVLFM